MISGTTFLQLELFARDGLPGNVILVNVDHISRIHPTWPTGCTLVMDDDTSALHCSASLETIVEHLTNTGGRLRVVRVYDQVRAELAVEHEAAEESYRDMLRHPETVVDAPDLFS